MLYYLFALNSNLGRQLDTSGRLQAGNVSTPVLHSCSSPPWPSCRSHLSLYSFPETLSRVYIRHEAARILHASVFDSCVILLLALSTCHPSLTTRVSFVVLVIGSFYPLSSNIILHSLRRSLLSPPLHLRSPVLFDTCAARPFDFTSTAKRTRVCNRLDIQHHHMSG